MMHNRILAVLAVSAVSVLCACSTPPAEPSAAPSKPDDAVDQQAKPGESGDPDADRDEPGQPDDEKPDPSDPGQPDAKKPESSKPESSRAPVNRIELRMGTDPCKKDADCVKATCCHASMCVSKDKAPSCKDAVCTLDCKYGTMDCGGGCVCKDGKCAANVWMGLEERG